MYYVATAGGSDVPLQEVLFGKESISTTGVWLMRMCSKMQCGVYHPGRMLPRVISDEDLYQQAKLPPHVLKDSRVS